MLKAQLETVNGKPKIIKPRLYMHSFPTIVQQHLHVIQQLEQQYATIEQAGQAILKTLKNNHKILLCGNGGSAADSQHIAAEFVVRYQKKRKALPALSLTTDTSILTAHTNDFEFSTVFSRQIEALGQNGDCLIAISTSGNSANILTAVEAAKQQGMTTIAMTGGDGGQLAEQVDCAVIVPSDVTARIQEAHILIAHWWCELAEEIEQ